MVSKLTTGQIKAARALLGWRQEDLAEACGVSHPTVKRLEAKKGMITGRQVSVRKVVEAMEEAGVIFLEENGEGPGVRLRKLR